MPRLDTPSPVVIDYTNWRGERSKRTIMPLEFHWGSNQWHPDPQWLLDAIDVKKQVVKTFAMLGIHSWKTVGDTHCEHGVPEMEYCEPCNREYKRARKEAGDDESN
jgi:hypothetical protein